jgi:hypothetical protein
MESIGPWFISGSEITVLGLFYSFGKWVGGSKTWFKVLLHDQTNFF